MYVCMYDGAQGNKRSIPGSQKIPTKYTNKNVLTDLTPNIFRVRRNMLKLYQ
jgi:hypothetical protein